MIGARTDPAAAPEPLDHQLDRRPAGSGGRGVLSWHAGSSGEARHPGREEPERDEVSGAERPGPNGGARHDVSTIERSLGVCSAKSTRRAQAWCIVGSNAS
ncbi:MAG: hypothetical protein OHK0013_19570 [Sandaracinaceae bacterium]